MMARRRTQGFTPERWDVSDRRRRGLEEIPTLGVGMVFTTPRRDKTHVQWCAAMNGTWLDGWDVIQVPAHEMAAKPLCRLCLA